jgi:hypothetical protein
MKRSISPACANSACLSNDRTQGRDLTLTATQPNKILPAGAVVALLVTSVPSYAQHATTKDQLIGTWKVETLKATAGDKVSYPLGERPTGYVTMTPERVWLLFVDSTRKAPAAATLTDAEAIAMMKSHVAWTGNYSMAEQTSDGINVTAAACGTEGSNPVSSSGESYKPQSL